MNLAPRSAGYEVEAVGRLAELRRRANHLSAGDVIHVHWTSPILQRASSERDAARLARDFDRVVRRAARRGVAIVWTVHNRLPHDLTYRGSEIALYRSLAANADAIHVMNRRTADIVADVVELPLDRLRRIPHPSFGGVYGGPSDRAVARERFGLATDETAVLFLGKIRPYKGVDVLFRALERAVRDGAANRPVLLLAGAVERFSTDELDDLLPDGVRSIVDYRFVPDEDLVDWFTAADVAVFPYEAILNSGSVHLAAAFGVPAVLPDEPHLRDELGAEPWITFFDRDDRVASLAARIIQFRPRVGAAAGTGRFNRERSPWKLSREYRCVLDEASARAAARAQR